MSGQDGYTASEALAALAILGLAIGGLTTSMGLIGAGQDKARERLEQSVLERAADQKLERLLAIDAPYRSDQTRHLVGDGVSLEFDCGAARCSARIEEGQLTFLDSAGRRTSMKLPSGSSPRFVYVGAYSSSDKWPPAPMLPPAPSWQNLSAVMIHSRIEGRDKPLVLAKVWRQQRADCEYDVVIQDCRGIQP